MESKIDEKFKYYFYNKSLNGDCMDFSIPINEFEELLKIALTVCQVSPFKNSFKLYGINNKFFKIFQDGSCFGYNLRKQEIQKMDTYFLSKITQNQIYNDDFAGLKTYWVEEHYEEIVFKLDDQMNLVFSKMLDIPRSYTEYSFFLEPKNGNHDIRKYLKLVEKIISVWNESNICENTQ